MPGISILTAMTLLTELYDISCFKTLDKLCSYVGLIPNTDSSGETDYKAGMTGRRNAHLRIILIESAWTAVRKDPALMMAFNELCKNMTKTKAIVRIARKLLNRIRYVHIALAKEIDICYIAYAMLKQTLDLSLVEINRKGRKD